MFPLFFLLFIIMPVVEIYVLIKASAFWGVSRSIGVILLTGFFGAWMLRTQGRAILMQTQQQVQRGEIPTEQIMDGLLVFGGGLLLLTPGFITDLFGFCMILPAIRPLFKVALIRYFRRMVERGNVHIYGASQNFSRSQRKPDSDPKEESSPFTAGEVIDVEARSLDDKEE